jgi:hypothetical protein
LACMSRAGTVDLILTEDSDAMLFGALQVARECAHDFAIPANPSLTALVATGVGLKTRQTKPICFSTVPRMWRLTPT